MRVTGCGDPRASFEDTLPGKLPQRKIAQTAAAGYSSYGNQIGLATGHVAELYHPGYIAKHLECGAVVAAGALPFWTSLAMVARDCVLWLLEDPVAPPMPSRPVRPPRRMTTSPGAGRSRRTFSAGAAATTAPHSRCLAM